MVGTTTTLDNSYPCLLSFCAKYAAIDDVLEKNADYGTDVSVVEANLAESFTLLGTDTRQLIAIEYFRAGVIKLFVR